MSYLASLRMSTFALVTVALWSIAAALRQPPSERPEKKVVCYYTGWAVYRGNASMFPEDIDPFLCTHIIYAFALVEDGKMKIHDPAEEDTADGGKGLIRRVTDLKLINPALKVLIGVGGWNMGSYPFEQATRSADAIADYVDSVLSFLSHFNLDGVDLDWEFPFGHKKEFTELCRALRRAFTPRGYLLTAAVSAGTANIDTYYEPKEICQLLDFINLMTYDFHGAWDANTQGISHHSPLNARSQEKDWVRDFNVRAAAKAWATACGCPSKLIIGIPTYGKSYRVKEHGKNKFGDKAECGPIGPIRKANEWAFFEVCHAKRTGKWEHRWHDEHEVPYMYNNDSVVTYDNPISAARKAIFIKWNNYGGAMFWTIDFDDFTGQFCGRGKFPIIRAVTRILQ